MAKQYKHKAKQIAISALVASSITGGLFCIAELASPKAQAGPVQGPTPQCQVEEGSDVDVWCIWIDPDTGDMYINPTPEEVNHNV
jgi:hypothetical protein